MRRAALTLALSAALVAAVPGAAGAETAKLKTSGSHVSGELQRGGVLSVSLKVSHSQGFRKIQSVEVDLQLKGQPLDQVLLDVREFSVSIVGDGSPTGFGQAGSLRGPFFSVNPAKVRFSAVGKELDLSFPIKLVGQPPAGARLYYSVNALGVTTSGFHPLTPPVQENKSGFSWGTLGLAIAVALFAGGFVGNLFSSGRRQRQGPSIYATVQRRLEEERSPK